MPEHNPSNPVNNAPVKEVRAHSNFDLSHYIFGTHRFGQYNIGFARSAVGAGRYPLRSSDLIDSYTLKAPLMQDVQKTKEFFFVPKQAILPINWDKIERLPALGDDVDASKVNSTVNFSSFFSSFSTLFQISMDSFPDPLSYVRAFARRILFAELFFSQGSLLAATGCHLSSLWPAVTLDDGTYLESFDQFFDWFFSELTGLDFYFKLNPNSPDAYRVSYAPSIDSRGVVSAHRFLELVRDNPDWDFVNTDASIFFDLATVLNGIPSFTFPDFPGVKFSIDRCAAYQLICAHYFSNDSIDYIHDADLWRQNMAGILQSYFMDYSSRYFSYNGVKTFYDVLSAYWIENSLNSVLSNFDGSSVTGLIGYFVNLLGWRRSLRFGDYFTGAKARPLAPGDFSVAVNNNAVSVIDVTKKISLQRLANNVNRIGNSIKEWYRKIIGSDLSYDWHNPMWLASTRSTVYAVKNENTNNADVESLKPVSTSANFAGRDSDFEFNFDCERNGEIIGITYYDIRRAYYLGIDRMLQHVDRFDGFIPDLQYIGDQDIKTSELVVGTFAAESPLAYTTRNMEYKQYTDMAYGGFVTGRLPGFAFLYKPNYSLSIDGGYSPYYNDAISPEFIRSRVDEFDDFYTSLTGFSNANYFHFIVRTFNDCGNTMLPMVFAPQIL